MGNRKKNSETTEKAKVKVSMRQRLHTWVDKVCDEAHKAKVEVQRKRHERAKKVLAQTEQYVEKAKAETTSAPARKLTLKERLLGTVSQS